MSKQELMKMQTCVLKVNIQCQCDGCKKKIKKLLQKVDGVYNSTINAEQGKVTVTGNVDPAKLIKKLEKSGKHAELWGAPKGFNNYQNFVNNQFKDMQSGKANKSQKGGKGGQQVQHQMQQFKGSNDLKVPQKDQKSAKSNLQDGYDTSDDDFEDDFDDEFDDDFDEEEEFGHGYGHGQVQVQGNHLANKMMPMMGKGHGLNGPGGMTGGPMFNAKKEGDGGGGGNAKKGGGDFEIPMVMKGKGNNNDGQNKGGGGDRKNGNRKGGSEKLESKGKKGGKGGIGGLFSFGTKSKNRREGGTGNKSFNNGSGAMKDGGKNDGVHDSNKIKQNSEIDVNRGGAGANNMGQMVGQMRPMGSYPAVQGLPSPAAMNGGYYQGMGGSNPYNQQYMSMMMNQQRPNGNDMFRPMMYAPPHPAVNYIPPPPMPSHPMADPITHVFSDENTNSCSIM